MGKDMKTDNGIKWTDQQAHVIDTRHGNLLVSAAAGSGKTAVLVERIIEMVAGRNSRGDRIEGSLRRHVSYQSRLHGFSQVPCTTL